MDNSFHNGDTGQTSSQPTIVSTIVLPPPSSNGDTQTILLATNTAVGSTHSGQPDGSIVGVNPIPDQSYQAQPGYQPYVYYGQQQNVYDNQAGTHISYGNMPQYNQPPYADSAYHTQAASFAIPVVHSPSPPPANSGLAMPVPPPVPVPENAVNFNPITLDPPLHAQAGPIEPAHNNVKLEKRCCGIRRKICLIVVLGICIAIALILFFIWPRVPDVTLNHIRTLESLSPYRGNSTNSRGFQGKWEVGLDFDKAGFVPWSIKATTVTIYVNEEDAYSSIGTSTASNLKPNSDSIARIPVNILYLTDNSSDNIWNSISLSCSVGTPVKLRIHVEMSMSGLPAEGSEDFDATYRCSMT